MGSVPLVSWGADGEAVAGGSEGVGLEDCSLRGVEGADTVGREVLNGVGVVSAATWATQRTFLTPSLLDAGHPNEVVVTRTAPTAPSVTTQTTMTVTQRLAVVANRLRNLDFICPCIAERPSFVTRPAR